MLICWPDCTCLRCGGVQLHIVKKVREGKPRSKTRSKRRARAIEATLQLDQMLRGAAQ